MNSRLEEIGKYIQKSGEVTLSELREVFGGVSSMTLYRDLEKLAATGEIIRTHGGARSIENILKEEQYSKRAVENIREKNIIAAKAYGLIEQNSSVFIDSGTTASALVSLLTEERLFVITADPNIALECAKKANIKVFMTGGYLNSDSLSLSGAGALGFLDNINIDAAFLSASGFSFQNAFTCGNYDECELKKRVVSKAKKRVMLMDSSKAGRGLPFTFAGLSDIDFLVTDDRLDAKKIEKLRKYKNINLK